MEENEEFDSDFNTEDIPISEGFWNYMKNYWHNNREFPESTESSLNKKADLVDGKVPSSQLPSYVDDVVEFDTFENLPNPGEKGKIYLVTNNNTQFRWSGSEYIQLNSDEFVMTTNTQQDIANKKLFYTLGGNDSANNNLWTVSTDGSYPAITFYRPRIDVGQIKYVDSGSGFYFVNSPNTSTIPINALEFRKSGSDNNYILLGGGSHIPVSEFVTRTTNQLITARKVYVTGGGNYAPSNNTLQIYADDGSLPSMTYSKGGSHVGQTMFDSDGFHFKNGDNNAYYDIKAKGFEKSGSSNDYLLTGGGGHKAISDFVPYSGAYQNVDLGNYTIKANTFTGTPSDIYGGSFMKFNSGYFSNYKLKIDGTGNIAGIEFSKDDGTRFIKMATDGSILINNHSHDGTGSKLQVTGNTSLSNRLMLNGSIKHNGLGLSIVNISGSGDYNSVLIKTGLTPGNMGTFTVKLYTYAHEYFEFNVSNYMYANSNYFPRITWKAGNSKKIERIQFLKDSNNVLYVNIIAPISYPRLAVTDLMVYGWEDLPFDSANWSAQFNGDNSSLTNEGQALPENFLRDDYLSDSVANNYWAKYNSGAYIGVNSLNPFAFLNAGSAQSIYVGGLLVSDGYADSSLIPGNGIYSKGQIATGLHGNSSQWHEAFGWGNHATAGYATQTWTSANFFSKNGGTIDGKVKITPGVGVTGNSPTIGSSDAAGFALSGDNGLWGTAFGHNSNTGDLWIQPQRFDGGNALYNINLAPLGGNVTVNNKTVATQSWVESQDYATHSFVEESLNQITAEHTNPDYPILATSKFNTVIITDEYPREYLDFANELIPGSQITVINLASFNIDVRREDHSIDRIFSRETTEYYITKEKQLLKKGSYKEASILS